MGAVHKEEIFSARKFAKDYNFLLLYFLKSFFSDNVKILFPYTLIPYYTGEDPIIYLSAVKVTGN